MSARVSILLVALGSLPATALAQLGNPELPLARVKSGSPAADRLSVYTTGLGSYSDHDATFDVSSVTTSREAQLVFKATNMQMTTYSPQIGLSYGATDSLLLSASVGVAWVKLGERLVDIPNTAYLNQHDPIFQYDLKPGFAATLGGAYSILRFGDFALQAGVRLSFTSSSHLQEDKVNGTIRNTTSGGQTMTIDEIKTEDVTLNSLGVKAHLGLEWRPWQSYLVNHFGFTLGYGYTWGSMTKSFKVIHTVNTTTDTQQETDTVGIGMVPSDVVGLYYGWSLYIPRLGYLTLEGQALQSLQVSLTYQYLF